MANIKSAKKRIKVSKTKTERNKVQKSKIKMFIKKIDQLVKSGNKEEANKILIDATKAIDMAASKGVYHKNNAARKVSRLTKSINKMS
ncbi:MAG: 30S ribosomal protein S20 [Lachnospiraceae bacterium]|nr:30S ribosomal protein S20 [Lachnospiraceae bacterium]